jgi:uncharacterized membrane protein
MIQNAPTDGKGQSGRQLGLVLLLAVAGLLLRAARIDRSYWFDELATMATLNARDWMALLDLTSRDNQPPLYNSLVFAWTHLFGYAEIPVRSLSLLFGVLAAFTPWLARRSLSSSEKLLCFAILSLMPLPIRYAQEARNYSLLFFLSASSLFCYYEILVSGSRRRGLHVLLYLSLLLLAFSHLFGLLLAASFLAVMFWRERRILPRLGLAVYGLALAAAVVVPLIRGGSGEHMGGNFWITFSASSLSLQLLTVFTPVGLILLIYAFICWRRTNGHPPLDSALLSALAPFALMLLGSIVISFNTPIVTDRNLIGLIAAFALLCTWLLRYARTQRATLVTMVLLCLLLVQSVVLVYSPFLFIQEDFRGIARQSIAADSRVCYVVPGLEGVPLTLFSFYVTRLYHRPDLLPEQLSLPQVPQDLHRYPCGLWADAVLQKRGVSVLKTLPQFNRCREIPLEKSGKRTGAELFDCRS